MKKVLGIAIIVVLLSSCGTSTPKPEEGKKKLTAIVVQNIPLSERR